MKKKICVFTGSRADYGIFSPVMKAISSSKDLKLQLIVTSMHLMKEFGYTVKEIERDGFNIDSKIDISYKQDTGLAMASSVGRAIVKFSKVLDRLLPDIVMVLGDRGEMLSAAIAANYLNIPVAHLHGGEVSGHVDGILRHAITKLSHLHFVSTAKAKERVVRLGEDPKKVFVAGAPALDIILNNNFTKKDTLMKKYGLIEDQPIVLIAQHPVSFYSDESADHMRQTLEAVKSFKEQTIVIYPNADAGGRKMIEVLKIYEKLPFIKTYKSVPHEDYLGLLKISSVLAGNSSSGIIEAPSFSLPVVNIGTRQSGRQRSGNVIDVAPRKKEILKAMVKAVNDKKFLAKVKKQKNVYGNGHASRMIVKVLNSIKRPKDLLQKTITY